MIGKLLKTGIRAVGLAVSIGLDVVTCGALGAIVKEASGSSDDTPFLSEGAGRKLADACKEVGREVDKL